MRYSTLAAFSRTLFPTVSLALAGLLCFDPATVSAQPPGGGVGQPDGGGSRRGRFGGDPTSLLFAMRDEKFVEKLELTEDQKKTLEQLRMDMFTAFRSGASREEMPNIMKEFEQKTLDMLTPEQKQTWEVRKQELKAESATRDAERNGGASPPGGAPTPGGSATTAPSPRRTAFMDEKPPAGAKVTASFGVRVADAASASSEGTGVGSDVPAPAEDRTGGPQLKFNFRYAAWADVLKLFAEAANLTLDLDEVPPGTFNYYDEQSYSVTEALDVLNGYLLPKGFVLIRRDRFLASINIDNGIPPNVIPNITIEELPQRGANELVSIVIPLEGLEADKIVGEIKELAGPWAKVSALKNTNSLVLMDTGSNILRIYRLLKSGGPMDNKETAFRAVPLKHISAAEAERTVRRLFGLTTATSTPVATGFPQFGFPQFGGGFGGGFGQPGFGGSRDGRGDDPRSRDGGGGPRTPTPTGGTTTTPSPYAGKINVTADTRTNSLLITATAALVKVVEEVVKKIDVDEDGDGNKIIRNDSPAYLKAYLVPGGDAVQVSRTLNALMPGLVVGEDSRSGKIHVHGTREEHVEIEKLVQTLAGEASGSVAVINLTRLDPIQATNTLKNLFLNDPRAPMIEPDAFGRRLLVRGSADQLAQVKILLSQLGEAGSDPQSEEVDRGNTRTLNLRGHDPQDILPLIQQMWDAGNRNTIRVVVPSKSSPVRDRRVPGAKGGAIDNPRPERGDFRSDDAAEDDRPIRRPQPLRETAPPQTRLPRATSILQVSRSGQPRQTTDDAPNSETAVAPEADLDTDAPASEDQPAANKAADDKQAATDAPPIGIMVRGDELIVTSEDKAALDRMENMFDTLASALPNRTRWTIFYLRTADATETAQMLERLFPQSSVTASTSSSEGLFGSMTSGLSTLGRGMMNVTGLNQTLGGAGSLRIITDIRANALFVTGPQDMIRDVEQMLELLDLAELPTDSLRDRTPRSIPVEFAEVDDVLEIVESVFKDAITPEQQGPGGAGARFNPLAMLMGGAGGGASAGGRKQSGPELAVTADRRTSHLIVFCNDAMFRQVEGLVNSIDLRARDARQTVRIMRLETADPALVSSTLTSLIPKVSVSASRGGSSRKKPTDPAAPGAQPGQQQPPDATRDAELLRRAMEQRTQGRPGGGGGVPGGGGGGRRFGR